MKASLHAAMTSRDFSNHEAAGVAHVAWRIRNLVVRNRIVSSTLAKAPARCRTRLPRTRPSLLERMNCAAVGHGIKWRSLAVAASSFFSALRALHSNASVLLVQRSPNRPHPHTCLISFKAAGSDSVCSDGFDHPPIPVNLPVFQDSKDAEEKRAASRSPKLYT